MPGRHTIQDMQRVAIENNGKCLSKEYFNDDTKLKWRCNKGHTWDASYTIIRQGAWCMQCVKCQRGNERLEELQQIAKKKKGKCLSHEYNNNHTKLKWECSIGHKWEATSRSIDAQNMWCPHCSGIAPRTIEDMQRKALERGGKCLSNKYINSQTKLIWQCKQKHVWQAKPDSVYTGKWCKICSRIEVSKKQRNNIAIYQNHAKRKGGKLLSKNYINIGTPMQWVCAKDHTWKATGGQVIHSGTWCPYCAGKAKHTIKQLQHVAQLRGGKCLSKVYHNSRSNLEWQCKKKHRWKASANNVINNLSWCLECYNQVRILNLQKYMKTRSLLSLKKKQKQKAN